MLKISFPYLQPQKMNVLHLACTRTSGNITSILKALLTVTPKEFRLQRDAVRTEQFCAIFFFNPVHKHKFL